MDLGAVCRGRGPTPELVLALIEHLPADSAYIASQSAERTRSQIHEWRVWQSTLQANLLGAELVDFTREGTKAHVGKKYKLTPHPRPGQMRKPRVLTVAEINRHIQQQSEAESA